MINNQYKQMLTRVTNQQLMPMTVDKKLTINDLELLSNQSANMPVEVTSTINFLLKNFMNLSTLGDKDSSNISVQDINSFSQQETTFSVLV